METFRQNSFFNEKNDLESLEKMRENYNEAIIQLYSKGTLDNHEERQKIGSYLDVIATANQTTTDLQKKANQTSNYT